MFYSEFNGIVKCIIVLIMMKQFQKVVENSQKNMTYSSLKIIDEKLQIFIDGAPQK